MAIDGTQREVTARASVGVVELKEALVIAIEFNERPAGDRAQGLGCVRTKQIHGRAKIIFRQKGPIVFLANVAAKTSGRVAIATQADVVKRS